MTILSGFYIEVVASTYLRNNKVVDSLNQNACDTNDL